MKFATFQFSTDKSYKKVCYNLLETMYTFSVVFGEVHYGLPRCVTLWGEPAINELKRACEEVNIKYKIVEENK